MKKMGGFRLFDNTQGHEIDFPKGPASNDRPRLHRMNLPTQWQEETVPNQLGNVLGASSVRNVQAHCFKGIKTSADHSDKSTS
jgi:hypothetical protein